MQLIRTFHPVGQGAFYSERHNDDKFTVVYDCGSITLGKEKLDKKIKSTFKKGHIIDVLFISHFHADHINGIRTLANHCKIKKVIIPFLDDDAKILLRVSNFIENEYSDTSLIDNPQSFFGENIPIIQIQEETSGEILELPNNNDNVPTISELTNESIVESGKIFKENDWYFIPFNYKQEKRKNEFVDALEKVGLKLRDIDSIDKIRKHEKEIKDAYNEIEGDLNTNSLILFSGNSADNNTIHGEKNIPDKLIWTLNIFECRVGCLYMGDIDLTSDINIQMRLGSFFNNIGTIQIPHHGSIHNFDKSFFTSGQIKFAILSYGTSNTYGHPSDTVVADLIAKNIFTYFVTEEANSIIVHHR